MDKKDLEEGLNFLPCFNKDGLIPCITTCSHSGDVLMFAFMNEESLEKSIQSGEAHYWSRSRQCLWHKGRTSGYTQKIDDMRTDCDQDCIWIRVRVNTPDDDQTGAAACHTGRKTCFYREIEIGSGRMQFSDNSERLFDPDEVYK